MEKDAKAVSVQQDVSNALTLLTHPSTEFVQKAVLLELDSKETLVSVHLDLSIQELVFQVVLKDTIQ